MHRPVLVRNYCPQPRGTRRPSWITQKQYSFPRETADPYMYNHRVVHYMVYGIWYISKTRVRNNHSYNIRYRSVGVSLPSCHTYRQARTASSESIGCHGESIALYAVGGDSTGRVKNVVTIILPLTTSPRLEKKEY